MKTIKIYFLIFSLLTSIFCLIDFYIPVEISKEVVVSKILTEYDMLQHGSVPQYKIVTKPNKYTCSKSTFIKINDGDTLTIGKSIILKEVKYIEHKTSQIHNNFNSIYTYNGSLIIIILLSSILGFFYRDNYKVFGILQLINILSMSYIFLSMIVNIINN